MSLHSTYNEKERHWPIPCFTRFLTSASFFEVGSESRRTSLPATGAVYGPIEIPRQQLFSDFFRMIRRPSKTPAPQQICNPLKKGAKNPPLLVWLAKHRSDRRPGVVI